MVRRIGVVQATGRTLSPAARDFHRLLTSIDIPTLLAHEVPLSGGAGRI
jgi:hypothetical protein